MLLIITGAGVYKDGPEGWTVHFRGKLDGTEIFEYDSRISRITTGHIFGVFRTAYNF